MNINEETLIDYFNSYIGIALSLTDLGRSENMRLPLYLRNGYSYHRGEMLGKQLLFAIDKTDGDNTPERLQKLADQLQGYVKLPVVFVFPAIEAYQRKRLIQRKIAFVVPFKQLFIPFMLLDLQEINLSKERIRNQLFPASQCLLLYHLITKSLVDLPFQEIAIRLGYASMTISRAAKELSAHGLCSVVGSKERTLVFSNDKRSVWNHALPFLSSPVKETVYLDEILPATSGVPPKSYQSGDTALAYYSDLAEGKRKTFAISGTEFNRLKHSGEIKEINPKEGDFALEVWNYNPALLSSTGIIDPLSLYLSMRHQTDDRIQLSLTQLIEDFPW